MKIKILDKKLAETNEVFEQRVEEFIKDKDIKFMNYAISKVTRLDENDSHFNVPWFYENDSYFNTESSVFIAWEEKE